MSTLDWIVFAVCWSLPAVCWLAKLHWDKRTHAPHFPQHMVFFDQSGIHMSTDGGPWRLISTDHDPKIVNPRYQP